MTHTNEQERAEFEAWASNEFGYSSADFTQSGGRYILDHLYFGYQGWQAARRAQVVPKEPTSKQVVLGAGALLGQPEHTADNRHPDWHSAVEKVRKVYMTMLAAAPQPPEAAYNPSIQPELATFAAPVQMPEAVAYVHVPAIVWNGEVRPVVSFEKYEDDHKDGVYSLRTPLYTEQQVRELLEQKAARIAELEKDAARLDWLDTQVKRHVVYNGYAWQEAGYESNRGLVCAIQRKKQKKTVRQAIDTAMQKD